MRRVRVNILRLIQRPLGAMFWFLEQHISRIEDRLANEEGQR